MDRFRSRALRIGVLCMAIVSAVCLPAVALAQAEPPELGDLGVDVAAFVPVILTALGAIVAVVLGGLFAIKLIRYGVRWIFSMGRG